MPHLTVKIFEFNTETYFMRNKRKFDTNINLEGLQASDSVSVEYSQPANMQHVEQFELP